MWGAQGPQAAEQLSFQTSQTFAGSGGPSEWASRLRQPCPDQAVLLCGWLTSKCFCFPSLLHPGLWLVTFSLTLFIYLFVYHVMGVIGLWWSLQQTPWVGPVEVGKGKFPRYIRWYHGIILLIVLGVIVALWLYKKWPWFFWEMHCWSMEGWNDIMSRRCFKIISAEKRRG